MELAALDLFPVLLLGGFLGSLVYIAAQDGPPQAWWPVFSPIVAGTLTANYMAHFALIYFVGESAASGTPAGFGAFLIGAGGPWTARAIARKAKAWNLNGRSPTP